MTKPIKTQAQISVNSQELVGKMQAFLENFARNTANLGIKNKAIATFRDTGLFATQVFCIKDNGKDAFVLLWPTNSRNYEIFINEIGSTDIKNCTKTPPKNLDDSKIERLFTISKALSQALYIADEYLTSVAMNSDKPITGNKTAHTITITDDFNKDSITLTAFEVTIKRVEAP